LVAQKCIKFHIDIAITFHKTVQFAKCDWSLHVSILCFLDNLKFMAVTTNRKSGMHHYVHMSNLVLTFTIKLIMVKPS